MAVVTVVSGDKPHSGTLAAARASGPLFLNTYRRLRREQNRLINANTESNRLSWLKPVTTLHLERQFINPNTVKNCCFP
ncbi:hypothetical protein OS11_38480 [Dickeya oryzae]